MSADHAPMPARDAHVEAAISHWGPRFVANGVPFTDFYWYRYRDQTADWMAKQSAEQNV